MTPLERIQHEKGNVFTEDRRYALHHYEDLSYLEDEDE